MLQKVNLWTLLVYDFTLDLSVIFFPSPARLTNSFAAVLGGRRGGVTKGGGGCMLRGFIWFNAICTVMLWLSGSSMSLLHDVIGDTDWLIWSIKMEYKLAEEPNLAICPNLAPLSATNQTPAFIPLIVSAMARCKCQMWPRPASLAPNTQPSMSSVCQNPLSADDASVFIILARDGGVIQTSFCSAFFGLTLWDASVGVRPGFSHPAWRANVAFITQIRAVKGSELRRRTHAEQIKHVSAGD